MLGDHGLRLGLEYVGPKTSWTASRYPFIHTLAEMRELIAEIGRDNVGLVLDSWHWYTAGETAADLRGLTSRDVVACDLNDAPRSVPIDQQRDGVRELPCATGVIDLKAFLTALAAIGYDGPVRAEPFNATLRTPAGRGGRRGDGAGDEAGVRTAGLSRILGTRSSFGGGAGSFLRPSGASAEPADEPVARGAEAEAQQPQPHRRPE